MRQLKKVISLYLCVTFHFAYYQTSLIMEYAHPNPFCECGANRFGSFDAGGAHRYLEYDSLAEGFPASRFAPGYYITALQA